MGWPPRIASSVCWLRRVRRMVSRIPSFVISSRRLWSTTTMFPDGRYSNTLNSSRLMSSPCSQCRSVCGASQDALRIGRRFYFGSRQPPHVSLNFASETAIPSPFGIVRRSRCRSAVTGLVGMQSLVYISARMYIASRARNLLLHGGPSSHEVGLSGYEMREEPC